MKLNTRNGGFTLVEIMIVVAIIALLATIAVPNFMRARQRALATSIKTDAQMVDSARDQWAIETNAAATATVTWDQIKGYIKDGSQLYSSGGKDVKGNAFVITPLNTKVTIDAATTGMFETDVVPATFWSPFN